MNVKAQRVTVPVQKWVDEERVILTMTPEDATLIRFQLYSAPENVNLSEKEKQACQRVYDALVEVSQAFV